MDWNLIEEFLLNSIWGMIILGALGSLLFYLILNVVGKANKGVKKLWLFYRDGRANFVKDGVKNSEIYDLIKWFANYSFLISLVFLVLATTLVGNNNGRVEYFLAAGLGVFLVTIGLLLTSIVFQIGLKRAAKLNESIDSK